MHAERLLSVASFLCGTAARDSVFEPLVADWQREWHHAAGLVARTRVLSRGGVAFAIALLVAIDTRDTVQRHTRSIGWAALPAFTLIGGTLYLTLFVWSLTNQPPGSTPSLGDTVLWSLPTLLSFGLVFALLPAWLVLAWDDARTRHLLLAGVLAVVAGIAIDGWLSPYMSEQRLRQRFGQHAVSGNRYVGLTVVDHVRQVRHPDPLIAANARGTLISLSMKMVLMAALGIVGGVVGRSRSAARKPVGLRTIAGYWLFGWAAANALHFFAGYLGYYLVLRPYDLRMWFPQAILLLIGVGASLALRRQRGERSEPPLPARTQ